MFRLFGSGQTTQDMARQLSWEGQRGLYCGPVAWDFDPRGILTRTMDTLLTFYIAGQNPTQQP